MDGLIENQIYTNDLKVGDLLVWYDTQGIPGTFRFFFSIEKGEKYLKTKEWVRIDKNSPAFYRRYIYLVKSKEYPAGDFFDNPYGTIVKYSI